MNYDEAVAYLDRHIELGWKPGLERIHRLLEMMGSPHLRSPAIHITGTNGKTTVTTVASSVLDAMGLKSGTFTSPHLERVEERFKVAGETATPEQFAGAVTDVAPFVDLLEAETGERATYFELTTAAAFALFAHEAVDVAVVEVGMGGRLDATNVLESQVAVLTGVSIDHAEYLGATEIEIAREKLAILKTGGVLVTGALSDEVGLAADRRAEQVGTVRREVGRDFRIEDLRMSVGGWSYDLDGIYEQYDDLYVPLHGRHQAANAAVAVAAVEELFGRALPSEAVRDGLAGTTVPARMEVVGRPLSWSWTALTTRRLPPRWPGRCARRCRRQVGPWWWAPFVTRTSTRYWRRSRGWWGRQSPLRRTMSEPPIPAIWWWPWRGCYPASRLPG